jgi:hypothetical protein
MNRTLVLRNENVAQALWALLKQNWRAMADQGKPLAVTVSEHKSKRSVEQNSRLHALLTEIAEQAWVNGRRFTMEAWKEHYKRSYIGIEEFELPDGKVEERGISTTTLDVGSFADFMTKIECHAAQELGVTFRL